MDSLLLPPTLSALLVSAGWPYSWWEAACRSENLCRQGWPVVDDIIAAITGYLRRGRARQVFVQMVEAACRPGTPQCFMFTPKLLPDLPYTRDVYPMSIFNGVHCGALTQDFQGAVRASSPSKPPRCSFVAEPEHCYCGPVPCTGLSDNRQVNSRPGTFC